MKLYEIANELGIQSIELLGKIKPLNFDLKSHMATLSDEQALKIRNYLRSGSVDDTASSSAKKTVKKKAVVKKVEEVKEVVPASTSTTRKTVVIRREQKAAETLENEINENNASQDVAEESYQASQPAHEQENEETHLNEARLEEVQKDEPVAKPFYGEATAQTTEHSNREQTHTTLTKTSDVLQSAPTTSDIEKSSVSSPEVTSINVETFVDSKEDIDSSLNAKAKTEVVSPQTSVPSSTPVVEKKDSSTQSAQILGQIDLDYIAPHRRRPHGQGPAVISARPGGLNRTFAGGAAQSGTPGSRVEGGAPGRVISPIRPNFGPGSTPGQRPAYNSGTSAIRPRPAPGGLNSSPAAAPVLGMYEPNKHRDRPRAHHEEKEDEATIAANKKAKDARFQKLEIFNSSDFKRNVVKRGKVKTRGGLNRPAMQTQLTEMSVHKRVVEMYDHIRVSDLADQMSLKGVNVIQKLMAMGMMVTVNHEIDRDTAALIADEFGYTIKSLSFDEKAIIGNEEYADDGGVPRPPVVTIMGHVDHGKTSILDYYRKSNVVAGEAGGITQHIGAYTIVHKGQMVTFLDTPGHEAFTAIRARGVNCTDIVILVVSATEGPKPQTIEAINHAKAAEVPIIVAVNKIDLPDANPDQIKKLLTSYNVLAEEWGGSDVFVNVSAKTGVGMEDLIDAILLQAEMLELKADPNRSAEGVVIESKLDKNQGSLATVLVQNGTLKVGDFLLAGEYMGRVRYLNNERGEKVSEAGPSIPVEVAGLKGVPRAGDTFVVTKDEEGAKEVAEHRTEVARQKTMSKARPSLETLFENAANVEQKELRLIIKADVSGTYEALAESLNKLANEKVRIRIMHSATGGITESDVLLAASSDAIIIGFNVRSDANATREAETHKIQIKHYSIIYQVVEDIQKAMEGLLSPVQTEVVLGKAEVRDLFKVPKIGTIAGSFVVEGRVLRNAKIRLVRENTVIFTGKMNSLKRFKDDAKEVKNGFECGILLEGYNDLKVGDVIESFEIQETSAKL